jgi:hypothetical protein
VNFDPVNLIGGANPTNIWCDKFQTSCFSRREDVPDEICRKTEKIVEQVAGIHLILDK